MSPALLGALAGLLIAAVEFVVLRMLARRVELPETKRVLHVTGLSQFVLFPIVGWFLGPMIAGE